MPVLLSGFLEPTKLDYLFQVICVAHFPVGACTPLKSVWIFGNLTVAQQNTLSGSERLGLVLTLQFVLS